MASKPHARSKNGGDELSVVALRLRSLATFFEQRAGVDALEAIRDREQLGKLAAIEVLDQEKSAGELILRAFELGQLHDLPGLAKEMANPMQRGHWKDCPEDLFWRVCDHERIQGIIGANGKFANVIGMKLGGAIPDSFPAIFPRGLEHRPTTIQEMRLGHAEVCRWLADAVAVKNNAGKSIPSEFRSKPMSLREAGLKLSHKKMKRSAKAAGKWLRACIDDGTVCAEQVSAQRWVFDTRQFASGPK